MGLLPAHAGVILIGTANFTVIAASPRTCGGDPETIAWLANNMALLPAHAGVILRRYRR